MEEEIPVHCTECNTRTVWEYDEVDEKAKNHEENLHDGESVVRVPVKNDDGHTVLAPLPEEIEELAEHLDMVEKPEEKAQ